MKFQVGDKVLVMHSSEEGEVVDIINDKMVMVDIRGVKFPAYTDQLEFPYFKRFTESRKEEKTIKPKKFIDEVRKEKMVTTSKPDNGIWLTFIPVISSDEFGDEVVEELKIHLVNETARSFAFTYELNYIGKEGFELDNQINPHSDFYLHDMPFENMNDSPSFHVVFSLLKPEKGKADSYETALKLRPKQAFTKVQEIRQKGEATFSYKLLDQYPDKMEEEKLEMSSLSKVGYKVYSASSARQHLEPAKYELDLHIEKLISNSKSLSNFEMLSLQLQALEKYLDLAVAHHQASMIIIHGVGTGKLRDEVHEVLRLRRDVKSFINRYMATYGYGATEVFFQY
ncbi:MAG: Smr/MutS family protein [Flavitalea sp.]